MKVFVATKEGQGKRKNDFSFTKEGELVGIIGFECDGEAIDGSCGCRRSMSGLETLKATTTFKVVRLNLSEEDFTSKIRESLKKSGWHKLFGKDAEKVVKKNAKELLNLARHLKTGKVLEKRGDQIQERNI